MASHVNPEQQSAREGGISERLAQLKARPAHTYDKRDIPGFDNGSIAYMDAGALSRPLDVPQHVRIAAIVALIVAAIIGGVILFNYFDAVVNGPAREKAALEESLAQEVSLGIPGLASLMGLGDEDILAALNQTGATLYERVPLGTSPDVSFEVVKLPDGMTLADAAVLYATGISNLSALDATKLLHGSWDMSVSRTEGTNLYVRYADFTSGSIQGAIENARNEAGLAESELTDSGIDEAGNTYATGTVSDSGVTYNWRISAISLDEVYDISGMPDGAVYVGIRLTE